MAINEARRAPGGISEFAATQYIFLCTISLMQNQAGSSSAARSRRSKNARVEPSELTVVVLPLTPGRDFFRRVPMLHQLAARHSKKIEESGMFPGRIPFAYTKRETALGQNAMDRPVVNSPLAIHGGLQLQAERG
jgi:hypothetical protein